MVLYPNLTSSQLYILELKLTWFSIAYHQNLNRFHIATNSSCQETRLDFNLVQTPIWIIRIWITVIWAMEAWIWEEIDATWTYMLFTWDTNNLCIVFKWWHIRSPASLIFSLLGVVALTAGYEAIRSLSRRYESWVEKQTSGITLDDDDDDDTETTTFLWSGRNQDAASQRAHVIKAALYAFQTFYAFMLMLLFMTYNGWVMIAVGVGAFVGFLLFGKNSSASKETACHWS